MATGVITTPQAESNTLRQQEEALRAYLADRLGIRTRFAALPGVRALLVSGARPDDPKGLVVDDGTTAAERIYLYVHLAAHVALRHNVPVMTIVEARGEPAHDVPVHRDAEELARAMWWGLGGDRALAGVLPSRRQRLLRAALAGRATRAVLRLALLAMRQAYYRLHLSGALATSPLTGILRRALCVTAVVCAAPQLARGPRRPL